MKTRSLLCAALATSLSLAPLAARAQDTQSAGDHFNHGVTLYEDNDYQAALVEFQRAYQIAPSWQVLFNIGQCQFNLRKYAQALVTFQQYVAQGGQSIPAEKKQVVDRELADLSNRVAKLTIASNLEDATVMVDDDVVGKTPFKDSVLVSAGTRLITATHEGRDPVTTTISVAGGDTAPVTLDFAPPRGAVTAVTAGTPVAPGPVAPQSRPTYIPGIIAAGIGVAGVGVGAIFGAAALGNKSDLDNVCHNKGCPPDQQNAIDTLSRNATISTVAFIVGGVGIAGAIYLLVSPPTVEQPPQPQAAREERRAARVTVTPTLGVASVGLTGTF